MRKLGIVFTKSKKKCAIGSLLIRLWTNKPYSHVARKLEIEGYKPAFYQASEGRVNYEIQEVFESKHLIVKEYNLLVPTNIYDKISKACFEEAGKKYGFLQNVGIVITDILKFVGIKIGNPFKDGQNCSELIYRHVLQPMLGCKKYDPDKIKPHHIEKILKSKCQKNLLQQP